MKKSEPLASSQHASAAAAKTDGHKLNGQAQIDQMLDLRFTDPEFRLRDSASPTHLTQVMQIYIDYLLDSGFIFSHEIDIHRCIGKTPNTPARMLAYVHIEQKCYALVTDLYHVKSWVYFTNYYTDGRRIVTTSQPGALQLEPMDDLTEKGGLFIDNMGSSSLIAQWKKHKNNVVSRFPDEDPLLMDTYQHLEAEQDAYRRYTNILLECTILRQSDTQLLSFTRTGVRGYLAAIHSKSARRPMPKLAQWLGHGKPTASSPNTVRNVALAGSAAVFALLLLNLINFSGNNSSTQSQSGTSQPQASAAQPDSTLHLDESAGDESMAGIIASITAANPELDSSTSANIDATKTAVPSTNETTLALLQPNDSADAPEQFVIASEEDEMWRIAVENAEFYLMSNDGDPTPWVRTARKMAAGFTSDDPRLARTYFLAALLEPNPTIAEQQYNRALGIQTDTLGLYHTETAQTLEALAWVAEGARDDLEAAVTHQRLALNVYRSVLGEEAEDTRAARWKLQYFEDRLAGKRPKSDENRRLLPAMARFAR